jgi:hypothetical protein
MPLLHNAQKRHAAWHKLSIDLETAIAVFGSNKTAGFLEQLNSVIYLVSRVQYESTAYSLSNAPTLGEIR